MIHLASIFGGTLNIWGVTFIIGQSTPTLQLVINRAELALPAPCCLLLKTFNEVTNGSRVVFAIAVAHNGAASACGVDSDFGPDQASSDIDGGNRGDSNALFIGAD